MISTDAKIFEEGSQVRTRVCEYGALFSELHIIVFTTRKNDESPRAEISKNIFAYPTNSISKLLYVTDAIKIGVSIITNSKFSPTEFVITTQDPFETGIVGEKLSEKFGIPLQIQIHTDFYSPYFKNSLLNKIRIVISNKTLPNARAIRVVSERIKNSLSQNLQAKTTILPIFADLSAIKNLSINTDLKNKYPQFKKIVLMASRLTREKDIQTAIRAFFAILGNYPDTGLIIVGSGPEEKNIQKEILASDSIIHLPWADYDTLISYMKTCDVFLSTSLYEGYGLSMLEAHTAGATLVATNAGIASLLVSDTAKPGDANDVARLLSKALSGQVLNKPYIYPYPSKRAYLEAYKRDVERESL